MNGVDIFFMTTFGIKDNKNLLDFYVNLLLITLGLIYFIYTAICLFKIAKKTNTSNAWLAWIPFLDFLLLIRIAKKPIWWIIPLLAPIIHIVASIIQPAESITNKYFYLLSLITAVIFAIPSVLVWMEISATLGKPKWLGILMIITPINIIIPGYLAFSKNKIINQGPTVIASV
jgi:hypothetical protein